MKLRSFLEVLAVGMPYTVGTIDGEGWLAYYDGEHAADIPEWISDRPIENIYPREYREKGRNCCELKAGLAIIVEGCENGSI